MATHCTSDCLIAPSPWIQRFIDLCAPKSHALDVAAGPGRHTAWMLLKGFRVTSVDIDVRQLEPLVGQPGLTLECRDLENEPWPYAPESFDVIVVTFYLHRAHFKHYWESLKPGGLFLMETFTQANQAIWGRPRNPDHYLKPRELLTLCPPEASLIAYEEGLTNEDRAVQRIVWAKPGPCDPYAYRLQAS